MIFETAIEYNCRVVLFRLHCAKCCVKIQNLEEAYRQYTAILRLEPNHSEAARQLAAMGGGLGGSEGNGNSNSKNVVTYSEVGRKRTVQLPTLNQSKGHQHSSSSGYLIPPKVPKILTEGRKSEQRKIQRLDNLFNGSCSLKDPLLGLMKATKKNPYVKE